MKKHLCVFSAVLWTQLNFSVSDPLGILELINDIPVENTKLLEKRDHVSLSELVEAKGAEQKLFSLLKQRLEKIVQRKKCTKISN